MKQSLSGVDVMTMTFLISGTLAARAKGVLEIDLASARWNEAPDETAEIGEMLEVAIAHVAGVDMTPKAQARFARAVDAQGVALGGDGYDLRRRLFLELQNTADAPVTWTNARLTIKGKGRKPGRRLSGYQEPPPLVANTSPVSVADADGAMTAVVASWQSITDYASADHAIIADTVPFIGVSSKPTTLGGYGITDAASSSALASKADLDFGYLRTSQIPVSLLGALRYQSAWNASTNTPALASGVGTKGFYYIVNVAGATNLNGETDWQFGDHAVFNGTIWEKYDYSAIVYTAASIASTDPTNAGAAAMLQAVLDNLWTAIGSKASQAALDTTNNNVADNAAAIATKTDKATSILAWAYVEAYAPLTSTIDANGVETDQTIQWPDGATGAKHVTSIVNGAPSAWYYTHVLGGQTITLTQPALTFDANGNQTAQPALVIS